MPIKDQLFLKENNLRSAVLAGNLNKETPNEDDFVFTMAPFESLLELQLNFVTTIWARTLEEHRELGSKFDHKLERLSKWDGEIQKDIIMILA